jgi:D-glycero-D-manno-heptose 1,7-bisphosphate phosphatase
MGQRWLILDRDGVINQDSPDYIKSPAEWQAIPGSLEAIARLSGAGWKLAVATNQAGLGRGLFELEALEAIHRKMIAAVEAAGGAIHAIRYCPHAPDEGCECRKPKPGLLLQLARENHIDLAQSWFVGDSLRDLQAAWAAKTGAILVRTGNGRVSESERHQSWPETAIFDDLDAVVNHLLNQK